MIGSQPPVIRATLKCDYPLTNALLRSFVADVLVDAGLGSAALQLWSRVSLLDEHRQYNGIPSIWD